MKIISENKAGYRYSMSKYDLNSTYMGSRGIPIGVLIMYLIAISPDFKFQSLSAEAEGELGSPHSILNTETPFNTLKEAVDVFSKDGLHVWELTGKYQGNYVHITGRANGTIISVRMPFTGICDIKPLLSGVEKKTHSTDIK